MNLSILIPLLNEEESLKELDLKVMQSNNSYEIIFLDDGTDNSWSIIEQFAAENPNVKEYVS
jgi:glycosyltransferase involved in cell wall biosynthesis